MTTRKAAKVLERRVSTDTQEGIDMFQKIMKGFNDFKQEMKQEMKQDRQQFKDEFHNMKKDYKDLQDHIKTEVGEIKNNIGQLTQEVKNVKDKVQTLENRIDIANVELEKNLDYFAVMEFRDKEYCLRFRAIPEETGEDIREKIVTVLAKSLEMNEDRMEFEIDTVYRINSRYATMKKIPRDVLVNFLKRKTRNTVLQHHFNNGFKIDGKEILVMKEIPIRLLRKRKEYAFFTEKLKQCKIQFRWDIPDGVIFTFRQQKYRLNTVQKARDFLRKASKDMEEDKLKDMDTIPGKQSQQKQVEEEKDDDESKGATGTDFSKIHA
ncbi:uncharacterized protein LOC133382042 [Rhineura floridana]|uniref:uncharacterized protein LOC133382042 n=1 Tax=Rhineura floridana TaxID=261503 RepID=UPI002AC848C3|nr:uncharacterized protein LOC133382042 [Rhineura floridana]